MKNTIKTTFAYITVFCLLLLITSCNKIKVEKKLQGSWRFREMDYIYTQNGKQYDMKKDGTYMLKLLLYNYGESLRPMIYSFSSNSIFISNNENVQTFNEITVSGNEIEVIYNASESIGGSANTYSSFMTYEINEDELKLTLKDGYGFVMNGLPESIQIKSVILYFKRGTFEDKDVKVETPTGTFENDDDVTDFVIGNGTAESPYLIWTAGQLDNIRHKLPHETHFQIIKDIDLSAFLSDKGGGWEPIQYSGNMNLDGQGHIISGLWIEKNESEVGFFENASNLNVSNLGIEIASSGRRIAGARIVGGLVGRMNSGKITNCFVVGEISGEYGDQTKYVGGIVGYVHDRDVRITKCYSAGKISGKNYNGDNAVYIGGIAGLYELVDNWSMTSGINISQSYSTANITGDGKNIYAGGIIGSGYGDRYCVANCYSNTNINVSAFESCYVGGIAGSGGVDCSYAIGHIVFNYTPNEHLYGITSGIVSSSYYNSQTTGVPAGNTNGISKTTAEMKQKSTYSGWDFTTIWQIDEGISYPYFK